MEHIPQDLLNDFKFSMNLDMHLQEFKDHQLQINIKILNSLMRHIHVEYCTSKLPKISSCIFTLPY